MAHKIYKVGVLTWHYYTNFGSTLQAFSSLAMLRRAGYDAELINYRDPRTGVLSGVRYWLKRAFVHTVGRLVPPFYRRHVTPPAVKYFRKKYFVETELVQTPEKLFELTGKYDCVLFGSDQIWAPNCYNPVYFGAFVSEGIRKVSYAASIGLNDIPDGLVEDYGRLLSDFHSVSVREVEGMWLLKERCGIDASVVLDPTLMTDATVYRGMERQSVVREGSKYVFCYFLNKEHGYSDSVIKYSRSRGLEIIGVSARAEDGKWMRRLTGLGADQFLWLVDNAEVIFTDSYHGTIFSMLFHKKFWTFVRFAENSPVCQNSRIRQLQSYFKIDRRIVSVTSELNEMTEIDYTDFEARLGRLREQSWYYLQKALS